MPSPLPSFKSGETLCGHSLENKNFNSTAAYVIVTNILTAVKKNDRQDGALSNVSNGLFFLLFLGHFFHNGNDCKHT